MSEPGAKKNSAISGLKRLKELAKPRDFSATIDQPFSAEDRVALACMLFNQMILNGSEYSDSTYYPLIFTTQALLAEPISLHVYVQYRSDDNDEVKIKRIGQSHSLNCLRRCAGADLDSKTGTSKMSDYGEFLTGVDIASVQPYRIDAISGDEFLDAKRIAKPSSPDEAFSKELRKGVSFFYILYAIRDNKVMPLRNGDRLRRIFESFLIKINRSSYYGKTVRSWISNIHRDWYANFVEMRNKYRDSWNNANRNALNVDKEVLLQIDGDIDYMLHDIFNDLVRSNAQTNLIGGLWARKNQSTTSSIPDTGCITACTNMFFLSKKFDSKTQSDKPDIRYHVAREHLLEFTLSNGEIISFEGDEEDVKHIDIDSTLDEISNLDVREHNKIIEEVFRFGNIVICSSNTVKNTHEQNYYNLICGYSDYTIIYVPIWLSGAPSFVVGFLVPKIVEEIGDVWAHIYSILTEMVKGNLSRRIRARVRERYAERLYYYCLESWMAYFSANELRFRSEREIITDLNKVTERLNEYFYYLSFVLPFDPIKINIYPVGSKIYDRKNAFWVGSFGRYSLFLERQRIRVFNRKFKDEQLFALKRGKNSIRRALRDLRIGRIDRIINGKYTDNPSRILVKYIAGKIKGAMLNDERPFGRAVVLLCRPNTTAEWNHGEIASAFNVRTDLGYAVYRSIIDVGERIRIYAPMMTGVEWDRFAEHYHFKDKRVKDSVTNKVHRSDAVLVFLDDAMELSESSVKHISVGNVSDVLERVKATLSAPSAPKVTVVLCGDKDTARLASDRLDAVWYDCDAWLSGIIRQQEERMKERDSSHEG